MVNLVKSEINLLMVNACNYCTNVLHCDMTIPNGELGQITEINYYFLTTVLA